MTKKKSKPTSVIELALSSVSYNRGGDIWIVSLRGDGPKVNLLLTPDMLRELHATCEEAIHYDELSQGPK